MTTTRRHTALRRVATAFLMTGTLAAAVPAAWANNPNPGIHPPGAKAYGHTYGEWSALWWQWAFSLPINAHPLNDTAPVSAGQQGQVWFLGGSFVSTTNPVTGQTVSIVKRSVTVPVSKALFFPVANSEASTVEGNGTTYAQLSAAAEGFQNAFTVMSCEIDGRPVEELPIYRVQSPPFVFGPLPANNVLQSFGVDAPAGTVSPSVSDGVYLLLNPFDKGTHTLHFHAEAPAFNFLLDVSYQIKVVHVDGDGD
jgi:hypothetical protein